MYYLWAVRARSNHVRLEQSSFQKNMVIIQCLVNSSKHSFSDGSTFDNVMSPIGQNLGLHDRHQPILLANDRIPSQPLRVLLDRQFRRLVRSDFQHRAPLGESRAGLVVLLAPRSEGIEALRGGFAVGAGQFDDAFVDLDAGNDAVLLEDFDERLPGGGLLVQSLLEEDDAGEVVEGVGSGEEELAKGLAVGLDVLDVDAG